MRIARFISEDGQTHTGRLIDCLVQSQSVLIDDIGIFSVGC